MDQIVRTPKQMGAVIQRQRRRLHLTQNAVGAKIKHRQATLSGLEAGKAGTSLGTLLDVLASLDLEIVVRPRTKGSPEDIETVF